MAQSNKSLLVGRDYINPTYEVREELINPSIKVGDKIRIHDGSSITSVEFYPENIYIVFPYPAITGLHQDLKFIDGEVVEVGITNRFIPHDLCKCLYPQDIVIKLGKGLFRTSSAMVHLIE